MSSTNTDVQWAFELLKNGPFAVLVAVLILVANKWEQVPEKLWLVLIPLLPWLVVVVVLLWFVVWLARGHREERLDLVKSLSKGNEVIRQNAEASAELRAMIGEMRNDLRLYRAEVVDVSRDSLGGNRG